MRCRLVHPAKASCGMQQSHVKRLGPRTVLPRLFHRSCNLVASALPGAGERPLDNRDGLKDSVEKIGENMASVSWGRIAVGLTVTALSGWVGPLTARAQASDVTSHSASSPQVAVQSRNVCYTGLDLAETGRIKDGKLVDPLKPLVKVCPMISILIGMCDPGCIYINT